MRQLIFAPGRGLGWHEVEPPGLSTGSDAIVRPVAVAVCDADRAIVSGKIPQRSPFRFGHEFVADIVEIGDDVNARTAGERVVVPFKISCGSCERCESGYTAACTAVPLRSAYGFGTEMSRDWGGAMTDLIRPPIPITCSYRCPSMSGPSTPLPPATTSSTPTDVSLPAWSHNPAVPVLIMTGGGGAPSISLYAATIAVALGSVRVDFVDRDPVRLSIAEKLGANPIDTPEPPADLGDYPITTDTSAHPSGRWLEATSRATAPYGSCTSCVAYFTNLEMPVGTMFDRGIHFIIGRVNARPNIPHVLDLLANRAINVEPIHTLAPWDSATETIPAGPTKLILRREGLST